MLNWEKIDEELERMNQDALYYGPAATEEDAEDEQMGEQDESEE